MTALSGVEVRCADQNKICGGFYTSADFIISILYIYGVYRTCTPTQSSEKSRELLLETMTSLKRKLASLKSVLVHVLPQVLVTPPRGYMVSLVESAADEIAVVQVAPPFHESSTQNLGAPVVLSTLEFNWIDPMKALKR